MSTNTNGKGTIHEMDDEDDDEAVITAVGLGKKYGSYWGLKNSTFSARKRELAVLLGPNGAGKTTTSKIFATVLKPSKGRASILGLDIVKDHRAVGERVSFLPQEHELAKDMTPLESVTWNLMSRGIWTLADARFQAKKWLQTLGMWDYRNKLCWTLSDEHNRSLDGGNNLGPLEDHEVGTRVTAPGQP